VDTLTRWLSLALGLNDDESPFPWQTHLLERLRGGDLPCALDIPTGLGKTAVMPIWLVARASGAKLPRRLVYVVDRRAVVDQATEVAVTLRQVVDREADLKAKLGLDLDRSLPISTLRGKHVDNREWLEDPALPAIVIGTVDMIGSRLLFGGYGVSRKMRPYHAGLVGSDTLIVLDEAHLVPPFERLIEAVASGSDGYGRPLVPDGDLHGVVPPLRFLSLSATGRGRDGALVLSDLDRDHPVVARRLRASKRTLLRDDVGAGELAEKLADEAWVLSDAGTKAVRCIIFCNRRDDAQKVKAALESRRKRTTVDVIDIELFVGARRVFEREAAARWLAERGFIAGNRGCPEHATFLIATSAGEVGVDLDADHMVCDLVAWERMVQRLGRVNRRGEGNASVVVVPTVPEEDEMRARLDAVRTVLGELPRTEDGTIDGSPGAITGLKVRSASDQGLAALIARASTPPDLHPPLTRATVESWSMTSLEEHTGRPEVAPWIRGWVDDDDPQTTIVWRKHLPVTDDGAPLAGPDLEVFCDAATPHLAERLETETWRAIEWLGERLKALRAPADGEADLDPNERPLRRGDVAAVLMDVRGGFPRVLKADDLSPKKKRDQVVHTAAGALLLVDVRLGGLAGGLLSAESEDAFDVTLIEGAERVVPFRVRRITHDDDTSSPEWRTEARIAVEKSDEGETAWLLVESLVREPAESEEGRSVGAKRAQALEEHEAWTEEAAGRIAKRLQLPEAYAEMLAVTARLHDEGKRAKRWQQAFKAPPGEVYAKTTSRPNLQILDGYRHELGSLPYAERHDRLRALDEPFRDLCLHLIAAHHGGARPLLRTDGGEEPPTRLQERAREVALRFARLEKRWGPWGLAWWEALLRAADQQASRQNDMEAVRRG
jgi:CRISPR-associated endonuclease/helicase Cas3